MCWAAIVDGRILPPIWLDAGTSVYMESYVTFLENLLWSEVETICVRRQYYAQQDGALCHYSKKYLNFSEISVKSV